MNDKELADKLVEMGIGEYHYGSYWVPIGYTQIQYDVQGFLSDWRVAGRVLEMMTPSDICHRIGADRWNVDDDYEWLRDPSAIIEAGVEALSCDT